MKNVVFLIMAFFITNSANAQFSFGGEAGLNFFNATQKIQTIGISSFENNKGSYRAAGKIGGFVNFLVKNRLDLRTGIYYSMKGFRNLTFNRNVIIFEDRYKWDANINYLEIPLNIFLRIVKTKKIYFGPGAYFGYGIGGKVRITTYAWGQESTEEKQIKFGEVSRDEIYDFRRCDYGVQLSAGYHLTNNLFIQAQYSQGLANTLPTIAGAANTDVYKNWGMTFSAGWNIESGRKSAAVQTSDN